MDDKVKGWHVNKDGELVGTLEVDLLFRDSYPENDLRAAANIIGTTVAAMRSGEWQSDLEGDISRKLERLTRFVLINGDEVLEHVNLSDTSREQAIGWAQILVHQIV